MSDDSDYTPNERRLLTLAVNRTMLAEETAAAANVTIRELLAENDKLRARLAEIAAIATKRSHRLDGVNATLLQSIEALAKGDKDGAI